MEGAGDRSAFKLSFTSKYLSRASALLKSLSEGNTMTAQ